MQLPPSRRRIRGDEHLIPLINVVFLMLIFFLLAGSIAPPEPFAIAPPVSAAAARTAPEGAVLTIDARGRLGLDGARLEPGALAAAVAARETVEPGADPPAPLPAWVLKADAGVSVGRLRETLAVLRDGGVARVTLLTVPGR